MVATSLAKSFLILAGSYTTTINTYKFTVGANGASYSLTLAGQSNIGSTANPSWIARHPTNSSILYSTKELEPGFVTSYIIGKNGLVTPISEQPSLGYDPAHLLALTSGEVIEPNYTSGSVQSHILAADGTHFTSAGNLIQFQGSGPDPEGRQASPHPHMAYQYGSEIFMPDLGSDKVWRLGRTTPKSVGQWKINGYIQQPAGSGPRHIRTIGCNLYTLHEIGNSLTHQLIPVTPGNDFPNLITNLTTLPSTIPANTSFGAAELLLLPTFSSYQTQRYLLASNRNIGANLDPRGDTIAIFATQPKLHLVKQVYTGLNQIRGMMMSNDGKYVIAAGKEGGGLAVFETTGCGANLVLRARYNGTASSEISSFVWL